MEKEKRINEILNAFEGVQPAEGNPFLATRVLQRIRTLQELPRARQWRLALVMAAVILLNLITIRQLHHPSEPSGNAARALASDYSITIPESY